MAILGYIIFCFLAYYLVGVTLSAIAIRLKIIQPVNGVFQEDYQTHSYHGHYRGQKFDANTQSEHYFMGYFLLPAFWPIIVAGWTAGQSWRILCRTTIFLVTNLFSLHTIVINRLSKKAGIKLEK